MLPRGRKRKRTDKEGREESLSARVENSHLTQRGERNREEVGKRSYGEEYRKLPWRKKRAEKIGEVERISNKKKYPNMSRKEERRTGGQGKLRIQKKNTPKNNGLKKGI